jgi:predicted regulator of Ras-like GTPase activity (Roadblock/LC7/MglB family)
VSDVPTKKKIPQIETPAQVDWDPEFEVKEQRVDLRATLERIKDREGVIGYILRAQTSASVDINDPSKIIDYAVLSASVLESAGSLLDAFTLGKICNIVVAGSKLKVLLLTIGEHTVSVFMEKNVNHESICKELT